MKSYEDICREYYSRIYKYALRMTGQKESAEDITQETFLIAYQKGKIFLNHENQLGFLYTTAHNLIMEEYRKQKKQLLTDVEKMDLKSPDVFETLCNKYSNEVNLEQYFEKTLSVLTPFEQTLYEKYYQQKIPMVEIAKSLGKSNSSIKMNYMRLRNKLKSHIKELELDLF
ncbi:MAG: sigma-70 family RNA polymerase sigma factor [Lachnospiraceae bacterium]|nr:sigma-70 family RNA polymerase sigma factor [Lachnospiraceae bacterium]